MEGIIALLFLTAIHFAVFFVVAMFLNEQLQIILLVAYICSIMILSKHL